MGQNCNTMIMANKLAAVIAVAIISMTMQPCASAATPLANACNVTEMAEETMLLACDCTEGPGAQGCQLQMIGQLIACKPTTSSTCRAGVGTWAQAYRKCSNAHDPSCYAEDPNYVSSQGCELSCK